MNIRRASRAVIQFYDEVVKPSGLTVGQLSLLRHLKKTNLTTISELAKMMRIDRTTLNRNMKPLSDAGFIAINTGQDLRTRQVMLTGTGSDAVVKGWELWGEAQASLKEYMGEEDMAKLVQLLSKLEAIVP
jgi:DNA-binding MarR family transcriptional regulator